MDEIKKYQLKDEKLFEEVTKLTQGEESSFLEVYNLSEKYIYKIIYDIIKDHQITEDLMQETYLQIFKKIGTLQEVKSFYVWAGRIATNYTFRYIQKYRKEVLLDTIGDEENLNFFETVKDDTDEFIPESVLINKEKQRLIAQIIDNLSVEQKLSIQYYYYEEMSVNDISQVMECSPGTVKSRLNYARKTIKEAVVDLDQKKGTRLYSFSTIPLLYLIFQNEVSEFTLSGVQIAGEKIVKNIIAEGSMQAPTTVVTTAGGAVNAGASSTVTSSLISMTFAKVAIVLGTILVVGGGISTVLNYNDEKTTIVLKAENEEEVAANTNMEIFVNTTNPDWFEEVPEIVVDVTDNPQSTIDILETTEEEPQEEEPQEEEPQEEEPQEEAILNSEVENPKSVESLQEEEETGNNWSIFTNEDGSCTAINEDTGQVYSFATIAEYNVFASENGLFAISSE